MLTAFSLISQATNKQADAVAPPCLDVAQEPEIATPVVTAAVVDVCLGHTFSSPLLVPAGAHAPAIGYPVIQSMLQMPAPS